MATEENEDFEENDIEEEMDKLSEEEAAKPKKGKSAPANVQTSQTGERYVAIHQPEVIAVVDQVKNAIVIGNFKDVASAECQATIMNQMEKIMTSLGA
jgi:hypothetical protein